MGDLLRQVTALREDAPSEAAVERAARNAVAQTLKGSAIADRRDRRDRPAARQPRGHAGAAGRLGSAPRRHAERRAIRPRAPDRPARPGGCRARARAPSLDERLMSSTSPEAALAPLEASASCPARRRRDPADRRRPAGARQRPARPRVACGPGRRSAAGPRRSAAPTRSAAGATETAASETDIKTSFIAAARRAAQAAQAELAAEAPGRAPRDRAPRRSCAAADGADDGRFARLRAEIDRRRRPLLLGLAAIVLALGALQAISHARPGRAAPRRREPGRARSVEEPRQGRPMPRRRGATETKEAPKAADRPPKAADQPTRRPPRPCRPRLRPRRAPPAPKAAVPQVSGMNSLQADLGNLPPALAKVRQRRPRRRRRGDLRSRHAARPTAAACPAISPLAAKLYEKLAAAGYAPAQYKLAGHYEKGSGVVRDLDKAKLWYGRAAEQGHARSMHNLAVLYAENPAANGKPDFASAASWFRQGAEFGVRDSQYNLGGALRPRPRPDAGSRAILRVVLGRRRAGRRGCRQEARRRGEQAEPGRPRAARRASRRASSRERSTRRSTSPRPRRPAPARRCRCSARRRRTPWPSPRRHARTLSGDAGRPAPALAPSLTAVPRCGNAPAGRRRTGLRIVQVTAALRRCSEDGWRAGTLSRSAPSSSAWPA